MALFLWICNLGEVAVTRPQPCMRLGRFVRNTQALATQTMAEATARIRKGPEGFKSKSQPPILERSRMERAPVEE